MKVKPDDRLSLFSVRLAVTICRFHLTKCHRPAPSYIAWWQRRVCYCMIVTWPGVEPVGLWPFDHEFNTRASEMLNYCPRTTVQKNPFKKSPTPGGFMGLIGLWVLLSFLDVQCQRLLNKHEKGKCLTSDFLKDQCLTFCLTICLTI